MKSAPGLLAIALVIVCTSCTDLREFEGTWQGPRVGAAEVLRTGFAVDATATLVLESVDLASLRGNLTVSGASSNEDAFSAAPIQELPAAEADTLSELTFETGQPARIFVTLVPADDGGGDAIAFVSLHREERIELRLLRGGSAPLYGVFHLERP